MPLQEIHLHPRGAKCLETQVLRTKEKIPDDDCGVVAVFSRRGNAAELTREFLYDLDNRGRSSAGIVWQENPSLHPDIKKDLGAPKQVFQEGEFDDISALVAIGHDRYTTNASTKKENAQPFLLKGENGTFLALAHNGNINNTDELKGNLKGTYEGDSDSALFAQTVFEAKGKDWMEKLKNTLPMLNGSASFTAMTDKGIYVGNHYRDNRPLWIGKDEQGEVIAVTSESYPLERKGMMLRPVFPGEIIHINHDGEIKVERYIQKEDQLLERLKRFASCSIEYIYLQKEESRANWEPYEQMSSIRQRLGKLLAQSDPQFKNGVEAFLQEYHIKREDLLVVGVPNGGLNFARGYAEQLGVQFGMNGEDIFEPPQKSTKGYDRSYMEADHTVTIPQMGENGNAQGHLAFKINDKSYEYTIDPEIIASLAGQEVSTRLLVALQKFKVKEQFQDKLKNKTVMLLDDSMIRGTVMQAVIMVLKKHGVHVVHARSGCPIVKDGCKLGIVMEPSKLLYWKNQGNLHRMAQDIGAASVHYQDQEDLAKGMYGEETYKEYTRYIQQLGLSAQAYRKLGLCVACMQTPQDDGQNDPENWWLEDINNLLSQNEAGRLLSDEQFFYPASIPTP
jgi:glutamine phosphoribosylpyrophosphate amidotransferase